MTKSKELKFFLKSIASRRRLLEATCILFFLTLFFLDVEALEFFLSTRIDLVVKISLIIIFAVYVCYIFKFFTSKEKELVESLDRSLKAKSRFKTFFEINKRDSYSESLILLAKQCWDKLGSDKREKLYPLILPKTIKIFLIVSVILLSSFSYKKYFDGFEENIFKLEIQELDKLVETGKLPEEIESSLVELRDQLRSYDNTQSKNAKSKNQEELNKKIQSIKKQLEEHKKNETKEKERKEELSDSKKEEEGEKGSKGEQNSKEAASDDSSEEDQGSSKGQGKGEGDQEGEEQAGSSSKGKQKASKSKAEAGEGGEQKESGEGEEAKDLSKVEDSLNKLENKIAQNNSPGESKDKSKNQGSSNQDSEDGISGEKEEEGEKEGSGYNDKNTPKEENDNLDNNKKESSDKAGEQADKKSDQGKKQTSKSNSDNSSPEDFKPEEKDHSSKDGAGQKKEAAKLKEIKEDEQGLEGSFANPENLEFKDAEVQQKKDEFLDESQYFDTENYANDKNLDKTKRSVDFKDLSSAEFESRHSQEETKVPLEYREVFGAE